MALLGMRELEAPGCRDMCEEDGERNVSNLILTV